MERGGVFVLLLLLLNAAAGEEETLELCKETTECVGTPVDCTHQLKTEKSRGDCAQAAGVEKLRGQEPAFSSLLMAFQWTKGMGEDEEEQVALSITTDDEVGKGVLKGSVEPIVVCRVSFFPEMVPCYFGCLKDGKTAFLNPAARVVADTARQNKELQLSFPLIHNFFSDALYPDCFSAIFMLPDYTLTLVLTNQPYQHLLKLLTEAVTAEAVTAIRDAVKELEPPIAGNTTPAPVTYAPQTSAGSGGSGGGGGSGSGPPEPPRPGPSGGGGKSAGAGLEFSLFLIITAPLSILL